jgi:hypothetical protein
MKTAIAIIGAVVLSACGAAPSTLPDPPPSTYYDCSEAQPLTSATPAFAYRSPAGALECDAGTVSVCNWGLYFCCPRECGEYAQ